MLASFPEHAVVRFLIPSVPGDQCSILPSSHYSEPASHGVVGVPNAHHCGGFGAYAGVGR